MNVKALIEALTSLPQDAEVIISRDPEGNGFHTLANVDEGTVPPTELDGYRIDSYYSNEHTDEQCCLELGEREKFTKVICLWP